MPVYQTFHAGVWANVMVLPANYHIAALHQRIIRWTERSAHRLAFLGNVALLSVLLGSGSLIAQTPTPRGCIAATGFVTTQDDLSTYAYPRVPLTGSADEYQFNTDTFPDTGVPASFRLSFDIPAGHYDSGTLGRPGEPPQQIYTDFVSSNGQIEIRTPSSQMAYPYSVYTRLTDYRTSGNPVRNGSELVFSNLSRWSGGGGSFFFIRLLSDPLGGRYPAGSPFPYPLTGTAFNYKTASLPDGTFMIIKTIAPCSYNVTVRAFISPQVIDGPGALSIPALIATLPGSFGLALLAAADGEGCFTSLGALRSLSFEGDNRTTFDPRATSFRLMTSAELDAGTPSGLRQGTEIKKAAGVTSSYASDALAGVNLLSFAALTDKQFRDDLTGTGRTDCTLKHRQARARTDGINTTVNKTPDGTLTLRSLASVANPLVTTSKLGPIKWDLTVKIMRENDRNVATVEGWHTCYPSLEIWVDDTLLYGGIAQDSSIGTVTSCLLGFPGSYRYPKEKVILP